MGLQSWPLFGLAITTPRITLRYVDDELAEGFDDPSRTLLGLA